MSSNKLRPCSLDRANLVKEYVDANGLQKASEHFNIGHETIKRYIRYANNPNQTYKDVKIEQTLQDIAARYSADELKMLALGTGLREVENSFIHKFDGDEVCFGVMSDLHLGSIYTDPMFVEEAFSIFAEQGVDFLAIAGDITEGVSSRQGHFYECSHVGVDAQMYHAVTLLSKWDRSPVYAISGNHDAWAFKASGVDVVNTICNTLGWHYLGYDEGDIHIGDVTVRLWHGQDGSSYAHSYRIQKVVESFTGGDKPNVLLAGHVHKMGYWMDRHVHCVSTGCIQKQSKWMRGKRLAAHTGFWVIRMTVHESGIGSFNPTWYPFYQ